MSQESSWGLRRRQLMLLWHKLSRLGRSRQMLDFR